MVQIPDGKSVGDVLPAFSGVKAEIRIGDRSKSCAGCWNPFDRDRKPHKEIRIYSAASWLPVAIAVPICRCCARIYRRGGAKRDELVVRIQTFAFGEEASQ